MNKENRRGFEGRGESTAATMTVLRLNPDMKRGGKGVTPQKNLLHQKRERNLFYHGASATRVKKVGA